MSQQPVCNSRQAQAARRHSVSSTFWGALPLLAVAVIAACSGLPAGLSASAPTRPASQPWVMPPGDSPCIEAQTIGDLARLYTISFPGQLGATMAFSPDSKHLVVGSPDRLSIVNLVTLAVESAPVACGPGNECRQLAFSQAGEGDQALLVVGPAVYNYPLGGGKVRHRMNVGAGRELSAVAISADGQYVAFASHLAGLATGENAVTIERLAGSHHIRQIPLPAGPVQSLAFSPDNQFLAVAGPGSDPQLWRVAAACLDPAACGPDPVPLNPLGGTVAMVAFNHGHKAPAGCSPDGNDEPWLVASSGDVWEPAGAAPPFRHSGNVGARGTPAISANGAILAIASADRGVVFHSATSTLAGGLTGGGSPPNSGTEFRQLGQGLPVQNPEADLQFSPNGRLLALGWNDLANATYVVELWGVSSRAPLNTVELLPAPSPAYLGSDMAVATNNELLALAAGREVSIWPWPAGRTQL
ncbi:MAG: hypothetical protein L0322_28755, partial [Chloroflexi bacterium]|nr:hypothetical protein [Chloroflexota bacterium]